VPSQSRHLSPPDTTALPLRHGYLPHRDLLSFPTRRSSDLIKTHFMKLCHLLGNRMGLKSILLSNLMTDMPKTCFHSSTMYGQRMAEHTNQEHVQQLPERSMNMHEELIC